MSTDTSSYPISKPSIRAIHEYVTPHKIAVAILIKNYCHLRENGSLEESYRRDFCLLVLRLLQSPDMKVEELKSVILSEKYELDAILLPTFLDSLAAIYKEGISGLMDVIESLLKNNNANETLNENDNFICRTSVVGFFLRKITVNFDQLSFSEVTKVYQKFREYIEESIDNPNIDENPDEDEINYKFWSQRQAELFIATQAELLVHNENMALPPNELQKRIENLLILNPTLAEAHFLSYLNNLRVKEFCGAVDSLFHCFDKKAGSYENIRLGDSTKTYRYASLNLAILHYQFGFNEAALASVKEAIHIAQSDNDEKCLQHALSWLSLISNTNQRKLLTYCVKRSFDLEQPYITSLGVLNFVKNAIHTKHKPRQFMEALSKTDTINCQNNLNSLIANNYAQRSALWCLYGKPAMTSLWTQLILHLNIDIYTKLTTTEQYLNSTPTSAASATRALYGEPFCIATCNMIDLLVANGDYEQANVLVDFIAQRMPSEPYSNLWRMCDTLAQYQRHFHREEYEVAAELARRSTVFNECEGLLRVAEVALYARNYKEAHRILVERFVGRYATLEQGIADFHSDLWIVYLIRAKILLVEIQIATTLPDGGVPHDLVGHLNQCLCDCEQYNLNYYASLVRMHIAHVLLHLKMSAQSLKVLDECMLPIMANCNCYDRARCLLLYAKCRLAYLERDGGVRKNADQIGEICLILLRAKELFLKIEAFSRAKDVLFMQAHLYNLSHLKKERDTCALEYKMLSEEYKTFNTQTLIKFL